MVPGGFYGVCVMGDFVMCDERRGGEGAERSDEEEREREMDRSGRGTRGCGWEGLNPVLSMESATWEFIMYCTTTVCMYVCIYIYVYIYYYR